MLLELDERVSGDRVVEEPQTRPRRTRFAEETEAGGLRSHPRSIACVLAVHRHPAHPRAALETDDGAPCANLPSHPHDHQLKDDLSLRVGLTLAEELVWARSLDPLGLQFGVLRPEI